MGILDDAIREHLELKRSHGASDDEIKRKEVEAFGAARREAEAAALAASRWKMPIRRFRKSTEVIEFC